uniref:RanBP2-type domain-containing protein n=1 Tax=Picea sitchensis TaxID=3332 RepID=B8LM87_PICSI|nr:unknown [Picea sitchensis]
MANHRGQGSGLPRRENQHSHSYDREQRADMCVADLRSESRDRDTDRERGVGVFYLEKEKDDQRYAARTSLSSLIVRAGPAPDADSGEVHNNEHRYHERGEILADAAGYDMEGGKNSVHTGSRSSQYRIPEPYGRDYDRDAPHHSGSFRGGRDRGRFEDRFAPPLPAAGRGRGMPPYGRGFSGPGYGRADSFPLEEEGLRRNNPNIEPREGDWICPESACGNINFAKRQQCNSCNKPRRNMAPFGMGIGGHEAGVQVPRSHPRFMGGPPMGRGMGRGRSGFGRPPAPWGRGGPGAFDRISPPRPGEQSPPDFRPVRDTRDRHDYEDRFDYRGRVRDDSFAPVDRPPMMGHRDGIREDRYHDRRGDHDVRTDRYPPSPPLHGRWGKDSRERSRSPLRTASRDYHRDPHLDRLRDDRRDMRRDRRLDAL